MLAHRSTIRIALVEADPAELPVMLAAIADGPGLEVVGAFGDRESALQHIPALEPDAVILHIEPDIDVDTVHLAMALRRALPRIGLVLLSNRRIFSAISFLPRKEMPGWSFLLKDAVNNPEQLLRSVEASLQGMLVLDPDMVMAAEETTDTDADMGRLTPKQLQTLQLLAEGLTNRAIARKMGVSVKAVEGHINQIYQELQIDRTDRSIHPRIRAVNLYFTQHLSRPERM